MTALVFPTMGRYEEWADCVAEYAGSYPNGSGMPEGDVAAGPEAYAAQVTRSEIYRALGADLPDGGPGPSDYLWITDGPTIVGFLRFTYELRPWLLEMGGHIGYSVRPSRRREGHASRALGLACDRAGERGIDRILVTCDETNLASARTIESQGGLLQDVRRGRRRYWITTSPD